MAPMIHLRILEFLYFSLGLVLAFRGNFEQKIWNERSRVNNEAFSFFYTYFVQILPDRKYD